MMQGTLIYLTWVIYFEIQSLAFRNTLNGGSLGPGRRCFRPLGALERLCGIRKVLREAARLRVATMYAVDTGSFPGRGSIQINTSDTPREPP